MNNFKGDNTMIDIMKFLKDYLDMKRDNNKLPMYLDFNTLHGVAVKKNIDNLDIFDLVVTTPFGALGFICKDNLTTIKAAEVLADEIDRVKSIKLDTYVKTIEDFAKRLDDLEGKDK